MSCPSCLLSSCHHGRPLFRKSLLIGDTGLCSSSPPQLPSATFHCNCKLTSSFSADTEKSTDLSGFSSLDPQAQPQDHHRLAPANVNVKNAAILPTFQATNQYATSSSWSSAHERKRKEHETQGFPLISQVSISPHSSDLNGPPQTLLIPERSGWQEISALISITPPTTHFGHLRKLRLRQKANTENQARAGICPPTPWPSEPVPALTPAGSQSLHCSGQGPPALAGSSEGRHRAPPPA